MSDFAPLFFSSWPGVSRIVLTTTLAYLALVLTLRVSGKRTLAKMNAFDLIVTVALGSCLASVSLTKSVKLVDGLTGILTLVALQYVIAWLSVRSKRVRKLVKFGAAPTIPRWPFSGKRPAGRAGNRVGSALGHPQQRPPLHAKGGGRSARNRRHVQRDEPGRRAGQRPAGRHRRPRNRGRPETVGAEPLGLGRTLK